MHFEVSQNFPEAAQMHGFEGGSIMISVPQFSCPHFRYLVLLNHREQTLRFFHRCRHFLDCSAPGGKSLQLDVHILTQKLGNCNLMSEPLGILSCLIVLQQISQTLKNIYACSQQTWISWRGSHQSLVNKKTKFRCLSPRANYADKATNFCE
jgi:hypothetical protein